MNPLSELKALLPPHLRPDLEALFWQFQQECHSQDTDQFLTYLLDKGLLDKETYQEIDQTRKIEVTSLDILGTMTQLGGSRTTLLEAEGTAFWNELTAALPSAGNYALLTKVGEGAMGLVHLAKDSFLRRKVAFKQLLQPALAPADVQTRFITEVQITAQLDHPHVVPVYTLEHTADGAPAYAMKLVQGKTLKELLAETRALYDSHQPLDREHTLSNRLHHFLKVCDALSFAHSKGVLHRDLKPANIMIGPFNEVYVMDWGIARLMAPDHIASGEWVEIGFPDYLAQEKGQIVGTPRYMSPEQAAGYNDQLDGRSDQFSLGLILFELVTLKQAITGKKPPELLKKVITGVKEPVAPYAPQERISFELAAIIQKATARKRAQRYASVEALADDIRRYLRGEAVSACPDTRLQRLLRWTSRNRQKLLVLMLGGVLVAAAATIGILYSKQLSLASARQREEKLARFLSQVSNQSQLVNSRFLKLQGLLESLAAAAAVAMEQKENFRLGLDPPDIRYSAYYQAPVSVDWPSVRRAPATAADLAGLARLGNLAFPFQKMFLESRAEDGLKVAGPQGRDLIRQGVPLKWAYVGLEQGIWLTYPGQRDSARVDPRLQPWYQLAARKTGIHWGTPYEDTQGHGLLLPCSMSIFDRQGRFRGVAGMDTALASLKQEWLKMAHLPAVQASYLVDGQGRVLMEVSDNPSAGPGSLLAEPRVVAAIRQGQSGYTESPAELNAFYRLDSLGWYFVLVADTRQLLAKG